MKKFLQIIFLIIITVSTSLFLFNDKIAYVSSEDTIIAAANKYTDQSENSFAVTEKFIDVPVICQYPRLPTGCEATAVAMVLQYYGINITAEDFASNWLACDANFYSTGGLQYGPDPNEVFAGNPFSEYSYGCYADPIISAINENSTKCKAWKITDKSLGTLCTEYIDQDKPLLIWATMNMRQSRKGNTWYLQDGTKFTWISEEHCLVLVGYDKDHYFLNDPQSGSTVAYEKELVELRFKELGSQAVYISE